MPILAELAEEGCREVAEGESREANNQFSMEPQSRGMLTHAEGAEREQRGG